MDKNLRTFIDFINLNENWKEKLEGAPYYLKIRQHPSIKNRYMFSYNMIQSDFSKDICKVARGIILDINENVSVREFTDKATVVSRAFDKFHNYHEANAAPINWNNKVYAREKVDGSLIKYTFDKVTNDFIWMTNNGFDANAELPGDELISEYKTFQDLINEAIKGKNGLHGFGPSLPAPALLKDLVLIFELVSPYNRIVIKYDKTELILLGARYKSSGCELTPEQVLEIFPYMSCYRIPKLYEFSSMSIEEIEKLVSTFGSDKEGIVVQDENFNRVKIKSSSYLSIHRMKDNNGQISLEHVLKCIQENTIDDVLANFPEYAQKIRGVINKYKNVSSNIDKVYKEAKDFIKIALMNKNPTDAKKVYALMVKDKPLSKIYFDLYKDLNLYNDIKQEFLSKLDMETLEKLSK